MKKIIILILLLSIPISAFGIEIPTISVSFKIGQKTYQHVLGANLPFIEDKGTATIQAMLEDNFGFLNFSREPNNLKLLIELDNKDRNAPNSSSLLHEVGFWITLKDKSDNDLAGPAYWMFRPEELYTRHLGSKEAFLKEISSIFKSSLRDKRDGLVTSVLSRIVLADKAIPIPEKLWWILPLKKENLRLELDSEFKIDTDLEDLGVIISKKYKTITKGQTTEKTTIIPPEYRQGMIVTVVKDPKVSTNEMNKEEDIKTIKVYIIKYIPSGKELKADSPEKLSFDKNGGN